MKPGHFGKENAAIDFAREELLMEGELLIADLLEEIEMRGIKRSGLIKGQDMTGNGELGSNAKGVLLIIESMGFIERIGWLRFIVARNGFEEAAGVEEDDEKVIATGGDALESCGIFLNGAEH